MPFAPARSGERFAFANQLRGFAAVCVVVNHFAGVYFTAPAIVAATTASVPYAGALPAFTAIAAQTWYNLGPFGVALFFLISGFVIPISLEKFDARSFLVARAFRIFPTYMCGLLLGLGAISLGAWYWHHALTFSLGTILANLFLVTDITGAPSIDLVNWTLMVELKFYLLMALLAVPLRRASIATLAGVAAAIVGLSAVMPALATIPVHGLHEFVAAFQSGALYVLFMMIGVVFYEHVRGRIGTPAATITIVGLFGAFVVCWPMSVFRDQFPSVTLNYGWALVVFASLYAVRARVPSLSIAGFFADISYPLYVIHTLVGWTIMSVLIEGAHVAPLIGAAIAFAATCALAFALHVTVERRTQSLGHAIATSMRSEPGTLI
jgi:peptidoglycan/LPS O-acetylase OafA/YrhL